MLATSHVCQQGRPFATQEFFISELMVGIKLTTS